MRTCKASGCIMPVFGTDKNNGNGFCKSHQYLRTDRDTRTVFQKHMDKHKDQKTFHVDGDINQWFTKKRGEMTGKCLFCGGKTEKYNDETFKRSIAHLLAKKKGLFPSIKTHQDNWLELCFYGNSCHTNFDNGIITWELLKDSKEWDVIAEKFKKIYPFIAEREIKNIPELLANLITSSTRK